jgi:hypothetical protein
MQAQLEAIVAEFESALERIHVLQDRVPAAAWARRPAPERWSPAECVAHLNLTSAAFLPLLRKGLEEARRIGRAAPTRYRRDFFGWMIWRSLGTPGRFRTKTTAAFVPSGQRSASELVAEFGRLQAAQIACVREADGLPLQRVKLVSPFDARVRYNLYSALSILPRHQHRHLWQAEQAAGNGQLAPPASTART